jgi:Bacterial SH3 domain
MNSSLKIGTTAVKTLSLLLVMNLIFSCSNNQNNPPKTDETAQNTPVSAKSVESIIVNGTVNALEFGKDGYTAKVQTDTEGVYLALVSIINVGGRENYKACEVGDTVSFRGTPSPGKELTVKEIIGITPVQTAGLATQYSKIEKNDYCWQVNKTLNLYAKPTTGSKIQGKHFAGETLQVLGTKTIGTQLWVNVKYNLKVKTGYEDQFADGQVTPSGSPTGWIGGVEIPKINCK